MLEFKRKPLGTYRAEANGLELDVWQMGRLRPHDPPRWAWNVFDGRTYLAHGEAESRDAACEAAMMAAKV